MNEWEFRMRLWWICGTNSKLCWSETTKKKWNKIEWKDINVKYSVARAWITSRYDHLSRHSTFICRHMMSRCDVVKGMAIGKWRMVIQLKNHHRILFSVSVVGALHLFDGFMRHTNLSFHSGRIPFYRSIEYLIPAETWMIKRGPTTNRITTADKRGLWQHALTMKMPASSRFTCYLFSLNFYYHIFLRLIYHTHVRIHRQIKKIIREIGILRFSRSSLSYGSMVRVNRDDEQRMAIVWDIHRSTNSWKGLTNGFAFFKLPHDVYARHRDIRRRGASNNAPPEVQRPENNVCEI